VRDAAARVVSTVCARFGDPLHNIRPRISKTLLKALLDRAKPVTTHYGALSLVLLNPAACLHRVVASLAAVPGWRHLPTELWLMATLTAEMSMHSCAHVLLCRGNHGPGSPGAPHSAPGAAAAPG
jgi:TAF6 C-terminal HEAT repeat domain